jgi:hypothetical protein
VNAHTLYALPDVGISERDIRLHGKVTPAREEESGSHHAAARRSTDVSKLTFPLQVVLMLIGTVIATTLSVTGAFWITTSTIRTDIAVIRQGQTDQVKIDEMKTKLEEANRQILQQSISSMESRLNAVIGQVQLANIEIGNVRREMNERKK